MRALVVYESMFGNTQKIAEAVAEGISEQMTVTVREVSAAPAPIDELIDLIVVGGPTHAFSLSRTSTRTAAVQQGATQGEPDFGLREWLGALRRGPHSELVACFDTRSERVRHLPGSAAHKAKKLAAHLGYAPAGRESFYVVDTEGPLVEGEVDRARAWGRKLGLDMAARAVGRPVV